MKLLMVTCMVAALLVVSPIFAQIPIGATGNLLVGAVYNTDTG